MKYMVTLDGKHSVFGIHQDEYNYIDRIFMVEVSCEEELKFLLQMAQNTYDRKYFCFPGHKPFPFIIGLSYDLVVTYQTIDEWCADFALMPLQT